MVGGEGPPRTTTTDARGKFSVGALRAGRYTVTVSKPGYVTVSYGQRRASSQGTSLPIGDGETRDIAMQLPRGGVITGMVLDESGEPAVNAFVRVMRFMPGAAERRPQEMGGDNTDDRGIYRIHSLQPGDYAVCANFRGGPQNEAQRIQAQIDGARRAMNSAPSPGMRQQLATRLAELQAQLPAQNELATGYSNVCFPGSSPTPSTMIPVGAGEEKSGIDIQLQLTQVARIEGTLVPPVGETLGNVQVGLVPAGDAMTPSMDRAFPDMGEQGRFVFPSVPAGHYRILARSMPMNTPNMPNMGPPGSGAAPAKPSPLWANAEVVVAGQDVTGVVLELRKGTTVSGQVVLNSTATQTVDLTRTMINLFPAAPEPSLMMFGGSTTAATVDAGGRFTIKDVFPGSYRISASFPGATGAPGWVVHSATVEGEDVLDTPLDVGGRTAVTGMVVTMTDRLTELSGIVVDEKGKPATDQTLVLYPVDEKYRVFQSRRIRTTRAGEDGRYTFRMIPPGDYRLATVLDPEPGSWYDKAVLGDLDSSAVWVSLAEGEKKIENVRVR
jgi:protocatechuate 3,4-dioxygenase beta subunit